MPGNIILEPKNIISTLEKKDEIIFGPFLGELGWEIMRWSAFVRMFAKKHPKKRIIVSTRYDRRDLYHGVTNEFDLFNIENDYSSFAPNCYASTPIISQDLFNTMTEDLKAKYPKAYMFEPYAYTCKRDIFDFSYMDFDFQEKDNNRIIIEQILKTHSKGKIPIVLCSRNRIDMQFRNWGAHNWKTLCDMIQNQDKYFVFVSGKTPSYYKSVDRTSFINLEDLVSTELDTSLIGLTISAIRHSKLTIGVQTGTIILSNLIGTPTLFWGNEVKRHAELENPKKTKSIGINDRTYTSTPIKIFTELNNFFS